MKKILFAFLSLFILAQNVFAMDVYYFYGKPRCVTCKKIETYTQDAVNSMNDKDIKYKAFDMDDPKNNALVKKYNLFTKAVILSKDVNGKEQWKNLDKIWTKVNNEQGFKNYITSEIKKFKGGK